MPSIVMGPTASGAIDDDATRSGARARRFIAPALLLVFLLPACVFWRTSYPTITWWDSSSYSLAASTLGITSPPGSLFLTLLGWPVTRLVSPPTQAHALNIVAGVLAALTVVLVFILAMRVEREAARGKAGSNAPAVIGAALGALTFAFSATLWEHAIKFTPYVLTAVFSALILLTLLRWWNSPTDPGAWRWIAVLGLLFGLDFSVHRTNALLIPGAIAWILIGHPRTLSHARPWLAGVGGLVVGLAVHLIVIPISASTRSPLNMFEPNTLSRFWDYISLANTGGNFLVDLWPRKAPFWSAQVGDFLRVFSDNFFSWSGPVPILGLLPALIGAFGLYTVHQWNRRLGIAFMTVLFLQAATTVIYFNIPSGYFRPFDRHYLPTFVTFGVTVACGVSAILQRVAMAAGMRRRSIAAIAALAAIVIPTGQLLGNWRDHDASKRYFAYDAAVNALQALPPDAIYYTVGDNDTFPVLYVQAVEGIRPDVSIVSLPLTNASWYVDQIRRRDPTLPLSLSSSERGALLRTRRIDTTLVIPIAGTRTELGLADDQTVGDTITMRPKSLNGGEVLPEDIVLLDLLETNKWRRPVTFAITLGEGGLGWLAPYARLEAFHWRIVPIAGAGVNAEALHANLLERFEYRGFADPAVRVDDVSARFGTLYLSAADALLAAEAKRGNVLGCREIAARLRTVLPSDRVARALGDQHSAAAFVCRENG